MQWITSKLLAVKSETVPNGCRCCSWDQATHSTIFSKTLLVNVLFYCYLLILKPNKLLIDTAQDVDKLRLERFSHSRPEPRVETMLTCPTANRIILIENLIVLFSLLRTHNYKKLQVYTVELQPYKEWWPKICCAFKISQTALIILIL